MLAWEIGIGLALQILTFVVIRYYEKHPEDPCPFCAEISRRWIEEVERRNREWEALLAVAQRLTHKDQMDLITLASRELTKAP